MQETIWLKPKQFAPLGSSIWVGTSMRKVEFVPRTDYLQQVKQFHQKHYTTDFLPLTAHRAHLFAKYDFKIADDETRLNIKVGCNTDKYLLEYVRLKIVDKDACPN